HVDLVLEPDRDRHGRVGLGQLALGGVDRLDLGGQAAGQDHDVVPGAQHAADDLTGEGAVVALAVLGADDVLDGEAHVDQVAVAGDVHVLQVVQQRRTLVPVHVLRARHDVVTGERRQRNRGDVGELEASGEVGEVVADLAVDV